MDEASAVPHFHMSFDGSLLARGFWIYVWNVRDANQSHVYVGRTGDSSSPNASSPFHRIGQHLDIRLTAKANSLTKLLQGKQMEPSACHFEMVGIGPLHDEVSNMDEHRPLRDRVGAIEKAVAGMLRDRNYSVLGVHHARETPDENVMRKIRPIIEQHFPPQLDPRADV